ncbi:MULTISPECIES: hypothetical protein [Lactobacillaceae]|uniref:hypothetical protein n=1 Tax=Lactobacillaceae TaxID=33958 RepID=UPI0014570AC3|nr:hypothetical protein [Lactobacillus sp. HBUAS51381]NLR09976.1 hypothetical protein [Lactobacillus sp. HBUAS51381]
MKKVVLFSSMLGVALFMGSAGITAHADTSSTTVGTSSVSTTSNSNATSSSVSGSDNSTNAGSTTSQSDASSTTGDSDSDTVEYDVGTVEQAIEEANNSQVVVIPGSNGPKRIMMFAARSRPNSLAAYKKLGYKHITYSKWPGTHKYAGTKAKRIAALSVEQLVGLLPGGGIKAALTVYDVAQAFKTQNADIWPTYNIRLISATTPRGNRAIIGQESTVKYYSNSKRTHLIKTIHHTMWVG